MAGIKLGRSFLDGELRIYRDRVLAFARENIQNAVDAKSKTIRINIENIDGKGHFTIEDDGVGMTEEQLLNVYFTLGETTKQNGDSVGGFGRARILTCFGQNSYKLWTGEILVDGSGVDYTLTKNEPYRQGVKISVSTIFSYDELLQKTKRYLSLCQLPCDVYVNGERWKQWTYRRNVTRNLSFGTVHANKSKPSSLLVRVNGTLMFTAWTSAPAQVIVEINQQGSREVLQASRDGMLDAPQREFESFLNELNIEKKSALKERRSKSTAFKGSGTFKSRRKRKGIPIGAGAVAYVDAPKRPDPFIAHLADQMVRDGLGEVIGATEADLIGPGAPSTPKDAHDRGFEPEYSWDVDTGLNLFDVVLIDDTNNTSIRKVIESYDPRNFDLDANPSRGNVRGAYRRGIDKLKTLLLWKAACESAIDALQQTQIKAPDELSWGIGWIFSDDYEAKCQEADGVHYLLLNPVTAEGKMRFSLSQKTDLAQIAALAAHEVVHTLYDYHDESYANALTEVLARMMGMLGDVFASMKAAKESASDYFAAHSATR